MSASAFAGWEMMMARAHCQIDDSIAFAELELELELELEPGLVDSQVVAVVVVVVEELTYAPGA